MGLLQLVTKPKEFSNNLIIPLLIHVYPQLFFVVVSLLLVGCLKLHTTQALRLNVHRQLTCTCFMREKRNINETDIKIPETE